MFPGSYSVPGNVSGGSSVTTDTCSSGSSAGVRSEKITDRIELCGKAGVEGVALPLRLGPVHHADGALEPGLVELSAAAGGWRPASGTCRRAGLALRAERPRELLELGEDLLTAVHLHRAAQEDEARAALASAHTELVPAAWDLVARIAERFLALAGAVTGRVHRAAGWPEDEAASTPAEVDDTAEEDLANQSH